MPQRTRRDDRHYAVALRAPAPRRRSRIPRAASPQRARQIRPPAPLPCSETRIHHQLSPVVDRQTGSGQQHGRDLSFRSSKSNRASSLWKPSSIRPMDPARMREPPVPDRYRYVSIGVLGTIAPGPVQAIVFRRSAFGVRHSAFGVRRSALDCGSSQVVCSGVRARRCSSRCC